jgi:hypothetical protein
MTRNEASIFIQYGLPRGAVTQAFTVDGTIARKMVGARHLMKLI